MNPATVHRIGALAAERHVDVLDAQVSGGSGAAARTLCMMIGGPAEVVERRRPLFAASADRIHHFGGSGEPKLAQQMMTVMNLAGVSESLRLVNAAGLDPAQFCRWSSRVPVRASRRDHLAAALGGAPGGAGRRALRGAAARARARARRRRRRSAHRASPATHSRRVSAHEPPGARPGRHVRVFLQ